MLNSWLVRFGFYLSSWSKYFVGNSIDSFDSGRSFKLNECIEKLGICCLVCCRDKVSNSSSFSFLVC